MFFRMLQRANFLLTEYQIFDFPIQLDTIDQIIKDLNIKIIIKNNLKSSMYLDGELTIGDYVSQQYRENLIHEVCHITQHAANAFNNDNTTIAKNEAQANAFAAYFLMPVFIFESDLSQGCNDFELSENFGVNIEFVRYRKTLTESLIHIGYFDEIYNTKVMK
ncbi:ImmA/IrrE family metallo-endopeptidase [Alkalibaculum sp. M08DMB]|uniref:ImmA/IrrE family metallo-endopeptidase n=1 Tax=Alkalibaculum sporogenes TaxID=2655001 RepID=A0A6A7KB73_9FIRM|nr:ImmA/IrrE family metallo-endopeptidase [Alkalibaculum sporogenes]MPW26437.1 ImmA/IrrE family metallo-endopeptidase [Alkalibaculum sporogenes]